MLPLEVALAKGGVPGAVTRALLALVASEREPIQRAAPPVKVVGAIGPDETLVEALLFDWPTTRRPAIRFAGRFVLSTPRRKTTEPLAKSGAERMAEGRAPVPRVPVVTR